MDFEDVASGHWKNKRANNVTLLQAHAFDHYANRCPGHSPSGGIPNPPTNRDMACPICGEVKGLNEFDEDHCPQRGGQSSFGPPSCVVRVCKACNNQAGREFEAQATLLKSGKIAPAHDVLVLSDRGDGAGSASWEDTAQMATDLKSAFLLAFATLGYRFAFGQAVRPIRQAILDGKPPPPGMGGPSEATGLASETVAELEDGGVVVVGPSGSRRSFKWLLPSGSSFPTPTPGQAKHRSWSWPSTRESGSRAEVDALVGEGRMFHADFHRELGLHVCLGPQVARPWTLA